MCMGFAVLHLVHIYDQQSSRLERNESFCLDVARSHGVLRKKFGGRKRQDRFSPRLSPGSRVRRGQKLTGRWCLEPARSSERCLAPCRPKPAPAARASSRTRSQHQLLLADQWLLQFTVAPGSGFIQRVCPFVMKSALQIETSALPPKQTIRQERAKYKPFALLMTRQPCWKWGSTVLLRQPPQPTMDFSIIIFHNEALRSLRCMFESGKSVLLEGGVY